MVRILALVLMMLGASFLTHAHKMKSAFTIVLFNERTEHIEVMHRFVLHDAEEAAWQLFDGKADIISDERTQAQFAAYVEKKFEIRDQNGQPLPLSMVGFQNDAGYFWVYQEIAMPKALTELNIRQDALRDIWKEQFNIVNVEGRGPTSSLQFEGGEKWRTVQLNAQ